MGAVSNIVQGVSDAVTSVGRAVTSSPIAQAAITVGGAMMGVPPIVTAGLLGVNQAANTGNIGAGLLTGGLSYLGGTGVNNYAATGSVFGAPTAAAGGAVGTAAEVAQAKALMAQGYSPSAAWEVVNATAGSTVGAGAAGLTSLLGSAANIGNIAGTVGNLAGSYLTNQSAQDAAKTQADAQVRAAQIAADAAKFRPVGVTTGFGSSKFGFDPATGYLTSAGYELTPEMKAQRDALIAQSGGLLTQAGAAVGATKGMGTAAQTAMQQGNTAMGVGGSLFDQAQQWRPDIGQIKAQTTGMGTAAQRAMALGNQYLATNPQDQAAKYYADQMKLLDPTRANEMAQLQAQMQAQGRGGFAIGGGVGGQGAANPQLQALLNAQMQQNNQLAANATQGGMDYAKFGAGMVGTGGDLLSGMYGTQARAYDPYNMAMNTAENTSKYGMGMVGAGGDMLSGMYGVQNAAYAPYNTALAGAQNIEGLGQNALTLGMDMGKTATAQNAQSGNLLAGGMNNAAATMAPANAYSPWGNLLSGASNALQNYKWGT